MALLPEDQFYVQRSKGGSKLYDKLRVSVATLESHILGGYQDGVQEINDRLDQEIQDRKDGDSEIYAQIDGLTDRINVISDELYDTLVADEYTHARDLDSRANFNILVNNNCRMTNGSPMLGEDFENCRREQLDTYVESVAGNPGSDSRGQFYLVSGNYSWEDTISIFLSDTVNGQTIDLSRVVVGSLIEIIGIKQDDNGFDIVDNFNYGFYKITHIGEEKEEYNDPSAKLFRFDVDHVGSAPRGPEGIPSTQDGENRFIVKLVVDLESILSEVFVNKSGDTMSGSLIQNIHDNTGPVDGHLEPGFHTTNDIKGARLTLTGYPDVPGYNPNVIDVTNTENNLVSFSGGSDTSVQVTGQFDLNYNDINVIRFQPEETDTNGDVTSPHVITFKERTLHEKAAEYLFPPNLLSPENNSPGLIPPRSYVDIKDELLQNAINDVSVRIDTLANASDVYAYVMMLPGENTDRDADLLSGIDNTQNPPGTYPTYRQGETPPYTNPEIGADLGIDPPYDSELYDNGIRWAQGTADRIEELGPNNLNGIFNYKTFKQSVINDQGVEELEDVDVFILDNETFILLNQQPAILNFDEAVKVGDYFEVSASDARTNAYAVYIVRNVQVNLTGQVILTCKILFKSADVVMSGFNYKIKFYDKNSGLTIEDTDILYVKKTGDEMTGPLSIRIRRGETNPPHAFKAIGNDGEELFVVDTIGNIKGRELVLQDRDDPIAEIKQGGVISLFMTTGQSYTLDNRGSNSFVFKGVTQNKVFELNNDVANFNNKRLQQVLDGVVETDAVTFGQLIGAGGRNKPFYSSDNTILITYRVNQDPSDRRVNFQFGTVPINSLSDVDTSNSIVTGAVLTYDGSKWVPTSVASKPFEPGDKVCYEGDDTDEVEVGGFRLSRNGVLSVRIS